MGNYPYERTVRLSIVTKVPEDFNFQPKVKGEIRNLPLWFYLPYITGLKEGSRHYIRSFNGVLSFLERIKKWVDVKKMEEDDFFYC